MQAVPLVEVPLRPPVQKSGARAGALYVQTLGVLGLLHLGEVELNLYIMTLGVAVVLVARDFVFEIELLGSRAFQNGIAARPAFP